MPIHPSPQVPARPRLHQELHHVPYTIRTLTASALLPHCSASTPLYPKFDTPHPTHPHIPTLSSGPHAPPEGSNGPRRPGVPLQPWVCAPFREGWDNAVDREAVLRQGCSVYLVEGGNVGLEFRVNGRSNNSGCMPKICQRWIEFILKNAHAFDSLRHRSPVGIGLKHGKALKAMPLRSSRDPQGGMMGGAGRLRC